MLRTATCTRCGATYFTHEMVATTSPKRGEGHAYICERCATTNEHYHANNNVLQGTRKVNKIGIGIEFETSYSDEKARNQMFEYGFIPTSDCSLNSDGNGNRYGWSNGNTCEYVSGIMQGLNKASKFCVTAEKLIQGEHMKVNESCGTHLHVSINSMKDEHGEKTYMGYIARFYNSLFTPLCEAMASNPQATEKLFGRYFNHYTKAINMNSNSHDRYNFINVLNNSNIEYRLCKFDNAKQYQEVMRFCVKATQTIVTNFCEHFNDEPKDTRRYSTITAYRKHKAQTTAKKLVKYFFESVEKLEA